MKKVRYYFPANKELAEMWSHGNARYVKLDVKSKTVTTVQLDNTSRPSFWSYNTLQNNIESGLIVREIKRKPHPLKLK